MVVIDKGNANQWGGAAPSVDQVASVFEGLGKRDDLKIQRSKQDGRPGVIATTTALGWDKPQWTAIYFGANGLTVHASGHDDKASTREACLQILRSIRFDP
jgi:hypothetical protein